MGEVILVKMNDCIFCKIVNGEIPCHKVWEDKDVLAFLSIAPDVDGHTIVIPKKHSENIFDIPEEDFNEVCKGIKKVSDMIKENFGASGVNISNNSGKDVGQEVMHIHFHILPRIEDDGRRLRLTGEKNINKNFEEILKKIKGELQ